MKLCERSDTPIHNLIHSDIVHLFPCVLSNDGNVLKPSIKYDPRLKENVSRTVNKDVEFVKKNKNVTPKFIWENIVTEVVISAVTTIGNEVSLPCVVDYKSRSGKTGDAMAKSWSDTIKILHICESCQENTTAEEHILKDFSKCKSMCDECISRKSVWKECDFAGQVSYLMCLRACNNCLNHNRLCRRSVFLVLTADCEEGNKVAFEMMQYQTE